MKTASFFGYTGPGRISIARYAPRGTLAGFKIYKPLAPGPWFNAVREDMYRELYFAQLSELDAATVVKELEGLAGGAEPILMCYETATDIAAGKTYCHRHMVAEWLKSTLGIEVLERALHATPT